MKCPSGCRRAAVGWSSANFEGWTFPVTLLRPDQTAVEARAIEIVRQHALRSLDALHLAVAELAAIPLAAPEECGFASRDRAHAEVAAKLGFTVV